MALIDVTDVQTWVDANKLRLDHNDDLPEEPFVSQKVMSRLSACGLDVSGWVSRDTTPVLIRGIIGMLVAAQRYNKAYSESDEEAGNPYANKLEERAKMLMDGICMGSVDLLDVDDDPASTGSGSVSFYPTDQVGILDKEEGVRFTMGRVF